MAIATLSIDIVAKLASFEQGMDRAQRLLEKNAAQMTRSFDGLKSAGAALAGVLGGAFAVGGFGRFVRQTVDGIDALNDLSDATGASIENISALEDIAARTGTAFDGVAASLVKFNQVLGDAKPGSAAAEALKDIGLNAEELKRLDPAEALRRTAVELAKFADDGNKARIVQDLFGKSVREVAPFLKDLAEQAKLNATLTTQQAKEAEKFNNQLNVLSKNATDAARAIAGPLVSALNAYFDNVSKLGGFVPAVMAGLGLDALGDLQRQSASLSQQAAVTEGRMDRMREELRRDPGNDLLPGRIDKARERLDLLRRESAKVNEEIKRLSNNLAPLNTGRRPANEGGGRVEFASLPGDVPGPKKAPKLDRRAEREFVGPELPEATRRAMDALAQNDLARAREGTDAVAELNRMMAAGTVTAEQFDAALARLRGGDIVGPQPSQQQLDDIKRLNELLADTPTAALEASRRDMALLAGALDQGLISAEQFGEAAQAALGTLPKALDDSANRMSVFAEQASRNIQDALGTSIKSVLKGDFESIGDLWRNLLADMVAQGLSAKIGESLFGKAGGGGGLFDKAWSFLFSAQGNAFGPSGRLTAFGSGGVFDRPTAFGFAGGLGVMGEAGPEAVMPLKRGSDGRLGVAVTGGRQQTVNNVFHVGAGVSRGEVLGLLQAYGNQLKGEILSSMRGGGAFAR